MSRLALLALLLWPGLATAATTTLAVVVGSNAIVRHAWEGESGNGDGKWNLSKIGILQVWVKQGTDWKLLARQAFKV